jgi:hypothetical protein
MVVDLPDPLGPRKPVTIPGRTVKLRSRTAVVEPYRLVMPVTSITADGPHGASLDGEQSSGR